jgi:hypothetical protein
MITQHHKFTAAYAAILAASALAPASSQAGWKNVGEFEYATIHVERNATDGDTEILMTAKPLSDLGVRTFSVLSPRWRKVVEVEAPARSRGLREFLFETPEPEASAILEGYPEGSYLFFGVASNGRQFLGAAELSHELPGETTILAPTQDQEVPLGPLTVQWTDVPDARQYLFEFENESADPEQSFTLNLPAGATSFEVPAALVVADSDYQVGVASVHENGNVVFVEVQFSTGE